MTDTNDLTPRIIDYTGIYYEPSTVNDYLNKLEYIIHNVPEWSVDAAREFGCIKTLSELGFYERDSAGLQQFRIISSRRKAWTSKVKLLSCLDQLGKRTQHHLKSLKTGIFHSLGVTVYEGKYYKN